MGKVELTEITGWRNPKSEWVQLIVGAAEHGQDLPAFSPEADRSFMNTVTTQPSQQAALKG